MDWLSPVLTLITVCLLGTGGLGDCDGMIARIGPVVIPWKVDQYEAGVGVFLRYKEKEPLGFKLIGQEKSDAV